MRRFRRDKVTRRVNLAALLLYSVAFGFVEAAVVYYLRNLIHFHQTYALRTENVYANLGFISFVSPHHSLLLTRRLSDVEIARESATLVMLVCVGVLAANQWRRRVGAFFVAFAGWDLSYYGFLRLIDHWPATFFTKDVFFLIPVASVGPVLTPLVLSTVLLAIGTWLFLY